MSDPYRERMARFFAEANIGPMSGDVDVDFGRLTSAVAAVLFQDLSTQYEGHSRTSHQRATFSPAEATHSGIDALTGWIHAYINQHWRRPEEFPLDDEEYARLRSAGLLRDEGCDAPGIPPVLFGIPVRRIARGGPAARLEYFNQPPKET